ncbi:MAG: WecB/TagA/CpsF family glycosyltransferase [Peptococcaceae bacterium]|nr:WecB/TagA/CpsF family glycosyltransferase [Peptococcaceae bacterium]
MEQRLEILGIGIDKVNSQQALDKIAEFIASGKSNQIVTANAEIIYQASKNEKMRNVINNAQMVTADGSGVVWASRQLGEPLEQRVTGIDLVNSICERSAKDKWKIYILGSAPGVAATAAMNIRDKFQGCNIIGTHHGYFNAKEEKQILAELEQLKPDVLFVALGAPKQEYWIADHLADLGIPVGMGIGGSMDVLSGNVKRAPKWMQKMSLEWLYRLLIQPTRFKRVLALPKFVLAVKKQAKQK